AELNYIKGINPNDFVAQLTAEARQAAALVVDVGQHQMWAAQSAVIDTHTRFITSGGMGAMGFALPAAIGASISGGGAPVLVIAGDGGFQLNIQELQTVVRNHLPIKTVILNNGCHGLVRQFQQSYFEERYQSTVWGYSAPDFAAVARAYGIESATISSVNQIKNSIQQLLSNADRPFLLQVMIDMTANAYPKVAFRSSLSEMEPLIPQS
ncbi:MAG: thiamine pyrophosphate-dependent enzyme, partial [Terriglobales bacterium]